MRTENTTSYTKPTLKQAVSEKLRILRDFCIVDDKNKREYKGILLDAVAKYPNRDYEIVLDQITAKLLTERFDKE